MYPQSFLQRMMRPVFIGVLKEFYEWTLFFLPTPHALAPEEANASLAETLAQDIATISHTACMHSNMWRCFLQPKLRKIDTRNVARQRQLYR
jgi:hypothetical protein